MNMNLLLYPACIGLIISSCGQNETEDQRTNSKPKLEFQSIETAQYQSSIELFGKVQISPNEKLEVTIPLGGKIIQLNKITGDQVKRGEILCYFENSQYLEIQKNYLHLQNQLRYERTNLSRLKQLPLGQSVSKKELEEAEFKVNNIEIQLASTKHEVEFIGIQPQNVTAESLKSRIAFCAPFTGKITSIQCSNGSYLSAEKKAFQLTGINSSYAQFNAFDKDIDKIPIDAPILISTVGNSEITATGIISSKDAILSENGSCLINTKMNSLNFIEGEAVKGIIKIKGIDCFRLPKSCMIEYQGKYFIVIWKNNHLSNLEVNWLGEDKEYSYFITLNKDVKINKAIKSNTYGIFMKNL